MYLHHCCEKKNKPTESTDLVKFYNCIVKKKKAHNN